MITIPKSDNEYGYTVNSLMRSLKPDVYSMLTDYVGTNIYVRKSVRIIAGGDVSMFLDKYNEGKRYRKDPETGHWEWMDS